MRWAEAMGFLRGKIETYDDAHNFTCDVCGREVFAGERICAPCVKLLPYNRGTVCPFCGRRVKEAGACLECKQEPLGVEKARSVFVHEGEAARLVVRFKRGEKYLFRTLVREMAPLVRAEFPASEAVTYVPMTKKAEKARGYNQSRLLAEALAKTCGLEFLDVAVKRKETPSQKFLGRRERAQNLQGCFHVSERTKVRGKKILIVDDTLTTGATVSALADVLKRAGAAQLCALTVTGVENKHPFGLPPVPQGSGSGK